MESAGECEGGLSEEPRGCDGDGGTVELLLKTLVNNISRFSSLSSGNTVKAELVQRYWRKIDEIFKLFVPVLEDVFEIASNKQLSEVLEELDAAVNEATGLIESWNHMMSKIYFVLQIESVITRIRTSVLETCRLLDNLFPSHANNSVSTCLQKMNHIRYDQTSTIIKEAIRDQIGKKVYGPQDLEKISYSLSLGSNQELLMEVVSLEKHKTMVGRGEDRAEVEHIDHVIVLVTHMHDCLVRNKQLHSINGVPIPADFCCPLSLELMSDPVIVASGQTYERAFIRKWLDQGLTVCPKTRQILGHTNLIPNYTVKALIANWCESNDIKLPDPLKSMNLNLPSAFLNHTGSSYNDSNIPHAGHSPRNNYLRSPEIDGQKVSSHKDMASSNGLHQEAYQQEKPTSPCQHPLSMGSPLHNANGCEANVSRLSLMNSEGKNDSSSEDRHVESECLTSGQSRPDISQCSTIDEQTQGHNRSVSASSAVSSNDCLKGSGDATIVSRVSSDLTHYSSDTSGEVTQEAPNAAPQRENEFPQRLVENRSRNQTIWRRPSDRFLPRIISSQSVESRPDLSGVETQVRKLIEDLKSESMDVQRAATAELRLLAKHNMENRIVIANCGAISLLVSLLHSADPKIQENAVTALLNLSINDNNKTAIANADAIDPLVHVLQTGNPEARENSAATLFSLSVIEENKVRIGRSGAIRPLVELLGNGTPRGKKDAATALFNLSIFHENKARIVQSGAVRLLVELMDPAAGMVDKAVAVLSNLATIPEGRTAIGHERGIPVLVEVVELGSTRGKENAAAALLQLCTNSNRFCSQVLQEGAVPPLVALSQSGTPRAREKAQALLSYFRNQRHGNAGRA